MNHRRPPLPAIIVVALLVIVSAYFIITQAAGDENGALTASGTIEATQVNIAPELAGRVTEVLADEGQSVSKNAPLLRLDPSLLAAQRAVAAAAVDSANAALASAQTKYDQSLQAALASQAVQRAKDWQASPPSEFDQPNWYVAQDAQIAAAKVELEAAQQDVEDALAQFDQVITDLKNSDYLAAEKRLTEARAAFIIAEQVKDQASNAADSGGLLDAAQDYYDLALEELDKAEEDYNDLFNTDEADDVEYARGQVLVAQQRYDAAYARLLSLQTGADSPSVVTAFNSLEQAKRAVEQAQASLDLIDTQIKKLTISAPIDSVVLTRNVEAGEFVQPGATAFILGQLSELTITVYVPENRYGELSLGQAAEVSVDSFPGEIFTATVVQIADKAEFTPRNVQTVEGRSSTVYAIKLSVQDAEGKLKIGMPADVVFK